MAKNGEAGKGRIGAVKDRQQFQNPKNQNWVKQDLKTGKLIDQKTSDEKPFKGVRKKTD